MIRNNEFQQFEMDFLRKEKLDVIRNFKIEEALYQEAVALGILPLRNPLDGVEVAIRIARAINHSSEIARWLKEFDHSLGENFLKVFRRIEKEIS